MACIIDGSFGHTLAVGPSEVVDVARAGVTIVGASSMGALRAAECWPAGVRGIGEIYAGYRSGRLTSDDEVAVAMEAGAGYAARSIPLVHVRAAVASATALGVLTVSQGHRLVEATQALHFSDRLWPNILRSAGFQPQGDLLRTLEGGPNLKRQDALEAVRWVAEHARSVPADAPGRPPIAARPTRSCGHDPHVGRPRAELQRALLEWLFGSGRFQPYVWALVAGEPEFHALSTVSASERPAALRAALASVLARLLASPRALEQRLWHELEFLEELDREILFAHAVDEASARATTTTAASLPQEWARETIAVAHGYRDWGHLLSDATDGRLYGAIPMAWIIEAVGRFARAHAG